MISYEFIILIVFSDRVHLGKTHFHIFKGLTLESHSVRILAHIP